MGFAHLWGAPLFLSQFCEVHHVHLSAGHEGTVQLHVSYLCMISRRGAQI